ncbi:hypothetical protein Glove_326g160 [Diversispora epigaea]|uniref:Uncharacterized protein n=1 Tax=Diversispora epigaea TaxID=1348612 RepID=A0A397HU89_9GLOM|nr:hypothetical protein Glove_326g160 [Diversispora epigaea]
MSRKTFNIFLIVLFFCLLVSTITVDSHKTTTCHKPSTTHKPTTTKCRSTTICYKPSTSTKTTTVNATCTITPSPFLNCPKNNKQKRHHHCLKKHEKIVCTLTKFKCIPHTTI